MKSDTVSENILVKALTHQVEELQEQVFALMSIIEYQKQELSFYKNRKNSGNSHAPIGQFKQAQT